MFLPRLINVFSLLATGLIASVVASGHILDARDPPSTPACFRCWKHFDDWTSPNNETYILVDQVVEKQNLTCFYVSKEDKNKQTFCTYNPNTGLLENDEDKICPADARPILKIKNCV